MTRATVSGSEIMDRCPALASVMVGTGPLGDDVGGGRRSARIKLVLS
jgi:hypothetical protein